MDEEWLQPWEAGQPWKAWWIPLKVSAPAISCHPPRWRQSGDWWIFGWRKSAPGYGITHLPPTTVQPVGGGGGLPKLYIVSASKARAAGASSWAMERRRADGMVTCLVWGGERRGERALCKWRGRRQAAAEPAPARNGRRLKRYRLSLTGY